MQISTVTFINLENRRDRLKSIKRQLKNCPYSVFRTNAIRPKNLQGYNIRPWHEHKSLSEKIGMLGCFLSHKQAITQLISLNSNPEYYSLILEDDVKINDKIWSVLPHITPLVNDADVLLFDAQNFYTKYHFNNKCISEDYPKIYEPKPKQKPVDFHGTHFVAIQNKKLQKILHKMDPLDCIINIDMWYLYKSKLVTYCVITNLIERSEFMGSDIKNGI